MGACSACVGLLVLCGLLGLSSGSTGDQNPHFKACAKECEDTGCINSTCFQNCRQKTKNGDPQYATNCYKFMKLLLLDWKIWDCTSECGYQCMIQQENERNQRGLLPVQYHGKWPFKRLFGIQEPASVAFSIGNLIMHLLGLISFIDLLSLKLPRKADGNKGPYYEFNAVWIVYGVLSINSWFWSAIFHSRDILFTERMDYLSAVAVIGYALIVAVIRTLSARTAARQMMVAVPMACFVCGHILYLNLYDFDYGLNMKVCVGMGIVQLFLWSLWGWLSHHPARCKLWLVAMGSALAMLLEIFDFPPLWAIFDAHSLWHALTIPLTCIWWTFIQDDAIYRTNDVLLLMGMTEATAAAAQGRKEV